MRRFWLFRGLRVLAFVVIAVVVFGFVVMWLWNWVLPPLTGWHHIDYAQAVGLVVLCRILFGGWRGHRGGGGHWREYKMGEHFAKLSPEERERFRQTLRRRCGASAAPAEGTSDPP